MFGGIVVLAVVLGTAIGNSDTAPTRPSSTVNTPPPPGVPSGVDPAKYTPAYEAPAPVIPVDPGPAQKITAREWQLIAKNPDAHIGKRVIVYGQVTQFDASTSTSSFRANVDAVEHKPSYGYADYETNTWLSGEPAVLSDLVQDDLFRAEVTVGGTLSYEAAIGGQRTVPALLVTKITVIGSV